MTLADLIADRRRVPLQLLAADKELAVDVQNCLTEMGLLDPPSDGIFATVSHWALGQALKKLDVRGVPVLDAPLASELLAAAESSPFALNRTETFAGRLVTAMLEAGHWLCRHPECINVIYVEGMNADGTINDDAPNEFNDLRIVLRINRAGNPDIVECWEATTEPGKYYTSVRKLDPRGAARIAFGQYKAWSVGTHMATSPTAHEALVQTAPIRVHRDLNEDFERGADPVFEGVFGINQHWGYDLPKSDIGKASAGCLVGRTKSGHRAFMQLCKADARYAANNGYRFMTAVLPAAAVSAASG